MFLLQKRKLKVCRNTVKQKCNTYSLVFRAYFVILQTNFNSYYMNRPPIQFLYIIIVLIIVACSGNSSFEKMDCIKSVGNENPEQALAMLDSLELDVRNGNEYLQNKYDLLQIRLRDKANIQHTSDIKIKKLVQYFEKNGDDNERQEACYYAGSVYRDLQDTPRALEYFFKSVDYAKANNNCDSVMYRNAYSNLSFLFYRVQNYKEAVEVAKQEQELSHRLCLDEVTSYMHIGAAYKALDSIEHAVDAYDKAYEIVIKSEDKSYYQEDVIRLLLDYSSMRMIRKAQMCKSYISDKQPEYLTMLKDMALGHYYEACENMDSAMFYYNRVVEGNADNNNVYDASKRLFRIYGSVGNMKKAQLFADIYMQLSDSLDFGKRQELAATVNNAYKYNLDERKEQELKDSKERYQMILMFSLFVFAMLGASVYVLYVRRRNVHLEKVIALSSELERLSDNDKLLREEIDRKAIELKKSEKQLEKSNDELNRIKREFEKVNSEFMEYDVALKEKEMQLAEKMEQNKTFIRLLHQSELEGKAEDVIHAVRQSAVGKKNMSSADWKQLYQAVDEMYPDFKDKLLKEQGTFTEQQMQVCYLMRIGLSKLQIQNMTNLSRVTVWRWTKRYDWVITSDDK